jgi:multidrug resistance efflux pump
MKIIESIKVSDEEIRNVNLRSVEVNEILGQIPNKIIRYGIVTITCILFLVFAFSFVFKHPDIISGNFYMQSANAPAFLLACSTGKLQSLLVNDKEGVKEGELLATIENATLFPAYEELMIVVKDTGVFNGHLLPDISGLGELQVPYANYKKAYQEFAMFNHVGYHQVKINSLMLQRHELIRNIDLQESQVIASGKKMQLSKKMFKRDSLLFKDKTIAALEYEQAQQTLLEEEMALTNNKIQLSASKNSLSSLDQQILELELNFSQEQNSLQVNLESAFNQLVGSINEWEGKYCLKSPIDGKVSFSGIWEVNQNVKNGQLVMSVLPTKTSRIIAKVIIPIGRAGKVKPGQEVNLKLYDFPFREYGMVVSKLHSISEVPDSAYVGIIFLSDSLITNHHRYLPFKQNMQGSAEIITEDLSLAERLINPLKDIFKRHIE